MGSDRLALVVALVALVLAGGGAVVALTAADDDEGDQRRTITAAGTNELEVAPDLATARLGVTVRRPEAQAATRAASQALRQIIDAAREAGAQELETEPVQVGREPGRGPEDGRPAEDRPYVARQAIDVRVRDLDRVAGIIDAAVRAGATDVAGPLFDLADPRAARRQALAGAVADARDSARRLAQAAGVGLGRVVRVEERDGSGPSPATARQDRAPSSPPTAPGPIEVRAGVVVVFEVE